MDMKNIIRSTSIAGILTGFLMAVASAGAQTQRANSPWKSWVGCWRPVAAAPAASMQRVCVVPASIASSVDIVTVDSGRVLSRETLDASGAERTVSREGCEGWQRASWSADSLRVFLRSEISCGPGLRRVSSGIMSIAPNGDWVDVQTVGVASNELVRTVRYVQSAVDSAIPESLTAAVASMSRLDSRAALVGAGTRLTAANILEAVHAADTSAVQAWLMERRQLFTLDGRTLAALADAGMPASITDMMVALSYPDRFRFDRELNTVGDADVRSPAGSEPARVAARYPSGGDCLDGPSFTPFAWGVVDRCFGIYDYGRYSSGYYGYNNRYGALGYSPYSQPYYGYYTRPIIIASVNDAPEHGRAVNGQGYTRGSSGAPASGTSNVSPRPSSRTTGTESSSQGQTSTSSTKTESESSKSGRTARPRPPLQ